MKKISPLILLTFILIACSPQVTVTSEVTVTLAPPTQTPIPTPTLHPQFVQLQNLISNSSNFILLPDGTIENNGVVIPNLHVDQNGVINLIINNEHVAMDISQVRFDDENGLTIDGYELDENGAWVEAEPKLENGVGEPTLGEDGKYYQSNADGVEYILSANDEWVRTFPVCALQEGQNCNFEQLADLSEFADFVQTQLTADMFDPAKINWVSEFEIMHFGAESVLFPDKETAPHYLQSGSAPWIRDQFTGRVMISPTEQGFVVAVPQFMPDLPPEQWPVMMGISSREGFSRTPQLVVDTFQDDMNIVGWRFDAESIEFATQFVNPITGANLTESEVLSILEEMKQGDFSRTHGLVLKMMVARSDGTGKNIFK